MAIKRKTTPKPAARPTPKPLPRPKPAPLDLVRSPNFDAALAQQEYQNSIADFRARMLAEQNAADAMGVKYIATMGTSQPIPPGGGLGGLTADQAGISPEQRRILDDLMTKQAQQPIPPGGGLGGQQQQMQNYQNFLQQSIQRGNTMNQDAATNFANMQAGAPTTEPATPSTAKPTMPVAGFGMQKSKAIPLPKTFSTRNNQSARFA